jgi:hypothetical protein
VPRLVSSSQLKIAVIVVDVILAKKPEKIPIHFDFQRQPKKKSQL